MGFRSKLASAWEKKKSEREQDKKIEQDLYEKKKYAREMESSAERFTKRREKVEERAEFRASGGYGGALKRGAQQTGKGFAKMGAIAGAKAKTEVRKGFKSTGKRIKTGMRGYADNPFGAGGGSGQMGSFGGGFDMFGGSPKPRKKKSRSRTGGYGGRSQVVINIGGATRSIGKKRRKKGKRKSSDPFNIFGNIKL